jgi:hypothetical protein
MPNGRTTRATENGPQTFGSSRKKQDGECLQFAQWLCDYWHIAATQSARLCPICHGQGNSSRVMAKLAESGEPVFTSMDVLIFGL